MALLDKREEVACEGSLFLLVGGQKQLILTAIFTHKNFLKNKKLPLNLCSMLK
jgi:hypothetical protein